MKTKHIIHKTLQAELVKKVDATELASRDCLKDLDQRLFHIIIAYLGSMDYGSLQILEGMLLHALTHCRETKGKIAGVFVEKDMEMNPGLKNFMEMVQKKAQNPLITPNNNARFN